MFQGLRTNSLFYVLDKGENPNLQIGQVVSVSNPQTKYPTFNNGFTPQPMETVVDVKVKADVTDKAMNCLVDVKREGRSGMREHEEYDDMRQREDRDRGERDYRSYGDEY